MAIPGIGAQPLSGSGVDLTATVFNVRAHGALGDGVTNDYAAIQAAIDAAEENGGGYVYFPAGRYSINSTLVLNKSSIILCGAGASYNADIGTLTGGTIILWAGAAGGTVVKFSPVEGASNQALKGVGLQRLSIDCAALAGIGLQLLSVQGSYFTDLYIKNPTVVGLDTNVVTTLGEERGVTRSLFARITLRMIDGDGANGIGIRCDGDSVANTSNNDFVGISMLHRHGIGMKLLNCDGLRFFGLNVNRASDGTAIGIELNASSAGDIRTCRANVFYWVSAGDGGLTARAGTFDSRDNLALLYSIENGEPLPTIEAGAGFDYNLSRQFFSSRMSANRGDTSVSITYGVDEPVQRFGTTLTADRTVTITNTGINGIAVKNGSTFRIVRNAGGAFNLTVQDSTPTTIKVLTSGQWVDVIHNGSGWQIAAFGSL